MKKINDIRGIQFQSALTIKLEEAEEAEEPTPVEEGILTTNPPEIDDTDESVEEE